jgi:integrase/recombinase XerD
VLVNFLMNSGCRAATARAIQNKDVELNTKRVVFRHNKNGKIQVIPLCSIMANILREYMRIRKGGPEDFLFCNVYGGELTEDAMRHAIAHYNRDRGVDSTSIHKFRHTFARKYLIDCGGDAFTRQKLLGHSTLEMTRRYCRIFDSDIAEGYDLHSPLTQMNKPKERIKR